MKKCGVMEIRCGIMVAISDCAYAALGNGFIYCNLTDICEHQRPLRSQIKESPAIPQQPLCASVNDNKLPLCWGDCDRHTLLRKCEVDIKSCNLYSVGNFTKR